MDVSNWGWGKLLQLPKHAFGRRFIISCQLEASQDGAYFDISEIPFPDRSVIWHLSIQPNYYLSTGDTVHLALGDQIPAAMAGLFELEPLIPGLGVTGVEPRWIRVTDTVAIHLFDMKFGIDAQGRRLVVAWETSTADPRSLLVAVTVSGVPREVPDWMVLG